jgi:hypothetical protein
VAEGEASLRKILLLLCAAMLSGCAMTRSNFAPQSYHTLDKDIAELRAAFGVETSLTKYYATRPETAEARNEFIAKRLALYDLEYLRFTQTFSLGRAEADALFDHGLLGLGLATTLAAGEHTKTVLGAVTTALTGSRASYEKNFYADKTSVALLTQMNAERKVALVPILRGVGKPIEQYPMAEAISDLAAYQQAGTLAGALQGVQKDAAEKDSRVSQDIERYRSVRFAPDDSTARLRLFLYPGLDRFANGKPLDAAGNVIRPDEDRLAKVIAAKQQVGAGDIAMGTFMASSELADKRAQVVAALNIP